MKRSIHPSISFFKHVIICLTFFCTVSDFAQKGKKAPQKDASLAKYEKLTSKYEFAGPFSDGLARVRLNKKWGFIDTTGAIIIPIRYIEVEGGAGGGARGGGGRRGGGGAGAGQGI